jgi:uncharacterized protein (DUF1697 family)
MPVYLSLFRGINVGGNHQVKMADLTALHEALGCTGVRSYIQSGSVVFTSDETDAEGLRARIEEGFERRFGFRSEVYLRTADQMRAMVERNPFHDQPGRAPNWVVVTFLPAHTNPAEWEEAIASYPGPEEMALVGDELHIYYCNGIGTSKLPNTALGRKLKTTGTARNWNTVLKLHALFSERE